MADQGVAGTSRARRALLLHVVRRSLTGRPRDTGWLATWSLVQALPSLVSGWSVAKATGDFLAGGAGTGRGIEWLALIGLAALASALASRQTYLRVAALVEPLRDDLVRMIVTAALQNATWDSAPRDTGAVARITHQAEIVRDTFAGLLAVGLTFAFTAASAIIGLATLVPAVLLLAVVPMAVSLALFCCLLPSFARWQGRSVVGEEAVADSAAAALAGLRDALACGAEDQLLSEITDRVTTQAAALRALARMNLLRTLCLAVGSWLPLILVLAAAPSLVRGGVGPGAIIGAVTYIGGVLQGALYTLTRGLGGSGIRLAITLQRIVEASAPPADVPRVIHDGDAMRGGAALPGGTRPGLPGPARPAGAARPALAPGGTRCRDQWPRRSPAALAGTSRRCPSGGSASPTAHSPSPSCTPWTSTSPMGIISPSWDRAELANPPWPGWSPGCSSHWLAKSGSGACR